MDVRHSHHCSAERVTKRWFCSGLVVAVLACGSEGESVPSDSHAAGGSPAVEAARTDTAATACVALDPAQVMLKGSVRKEQRLGPPGYGETPARDLKDTILVLRLQQPITVCSDSVGPDRRPTVNVTELQLTGHVGDVEPRLNQTIGLHGKLFRRELGGHYTDVLIRVDSVEGGRRRRTPIV